MNTEIDKKVVDALALVVALKTGIDEDYALVAQKVINDYRGAQKLIREYNETAAKAAKKLAKAEKKAADELKRQKASQKASAKAAKKAVG